MVSPILEDMIQDQMIETVVKTTAQGLQKQWEEFSAGPSEEEQQRQEEEKKKKVEADAAQVQQDLAAENLPAVDRETLKQRALEMKDSSSITEQLKMQIAQLREALEKNNKNIKTTPTTGRTARGVDAVRDSRVDEVVISEMGVGSEGLSTAAELRAKLWAEEELVQGGLGTAGPAGSAPKQEKGFSLDKSRKGTKVYKAAEPVST